MVRLVAREAPSAFQRLRSDGVLLKERGAQRCVVSPDPSVIPGVALMRKLAGLVKNLDGVHVLPGFQITELPCHNGRVCGVRGFNRKGEEMDIDAPAVVLAAGGAGAIYRRHDNQKKILGQGYALAAQAGIDLWDMEFVQFFPLVLADPRLPALIVYPPFAREARLVDSSGESILEKTVSGMSTRRSSRSATPSRPFSSRRRRRGAFFSTFARFPIRHGMFIPWPSSKSFASISGDSPWPLPPPSTSPWAV